MDSLQSTYPIDKSALEKARHAWSEALASEIDFWIRWMATRGLEWPEDYRQRTDPDSELPEGIGKFLNNSRASKILDVGAGPMTLLGKKWKGEPVRLVACDALASAYEQLPFPPGLPLVKTIQCDSENLTSCFPENEFDIVHAQNTLDHSYEPLMAIMQMIAVARPGGVVCLNHIANEGEKEGYAGLHQWNFEIAGRELWLHNRSMRISVSRAIESIARVEELSPDGSAWCWAVVRKFDRHVCHIGVEKSLVSVVIPCYKHAGFLREAVESVIQQSYPHWECIIVNDGSPDNTSEVARSIIQANPDQRIRLIEKSNGGLSSARNVGIRASLGRYILPLDADDKLHPDMLARTVSELDGNSDIGIAFTYIQHFGDQVDVWQTGPFNLETEIRDNRIAYCSLYRREVFDVVGGYDETFNSYEDWNFWLSALERGWAGQLIPEPLFLYRKSGSSMLTEANKRRELLVAQIVRAHPSLYSSEQLAWMNRVFDEAAGKASAASQKHIAAATTHGQAQVLSDDRRGCKILIACDFFWPSIGGVESIAKNLGVYFQQQGFTVEVATRALPVRSADRYCDMQIHSIPVAMHGMPWESPAAIELRKLILEGNYSSVIMLADPLTWVLWALEGLSRNIGARIIVQPLINDEGYAHWKGHGEMRSRLRAVLERADEVVKLTRSGCDANYLNEEGIPATFVPNATTPVSEPTNVRAELGIPDDVPLLLQVGNLSPVKNQFGLLNAMRPAPGDWRLVLVGYPSLDETYVGSVKEAVAQDSRVILVPGWPTEKVGALMETAQLVLMPSLAEVSPVVLLEAMSHGRAWLATQCCGAVSDLAGGLAVPLNTFPVLVELLLADAGLREAFGRAGRAHWQASFSWGRVGAVWCELVDKGTTMEAFEMPEEIAKSMPTLLAAVHERLEHAMAATGIGQGQEQVQSVGNESGRNVFGSAGTLVSVIVPTHNRPELLVRAIQSIKNQTYSPLEVVVVNDAGADVESLVSWLAKDANIVYVRHGVNRGLAAARNTGLSVARGEIITYLDDDDVFLPDHVATVVETLQKESNPFVYTEAEYIVETAEHGQMKELGRGRPYTNVVYSKERLHIGNFIPVNTWGHWKNTLARTGNFDESLDNHEDWDFLLRCSRQFDFTHIPKLTVQVHQRTQTDNMLRRERHKFHDTYQMLYARYDDLGNPKVAQGRQQMLQQLLTQGEAPPVVVQQNERVEEAEHGCREYHAWRSKRTLQEIDAQIFAERMTLKWKERPVFHLVIMLERGQESLLVDTLDALAGQFYSEWRLTVVAHFATPDAAFHEVPNLKWLEMQDVSDRQEMMRQVIEGAGQGWVMLLPAGVKMEVHTFLRIGDYINLHPEWRLIYGDDDQIDSSGKFIEPRFKPDFNLDMLRSTDYIGPCLFRADALVQAGGFSILQGAEGYDMILRMLDQHGEAVIGHIADALLHLPFNWDSVGHEENRRCAGAAHLRRAGIAAAVEPGYVPGTHRVVYERPDDPLVSIIIPNRDKLEFLQPCVESVLEKTSYQNYEILIVDNDSSDPDVLDYYRELVANNEDRVRVLHYGAEFNFSAMNNLAAREARGAYLLLLNNDTQVIQSEWLERMLSYGQREDVAAVGSRLVFPESGKIQHAGVVLGLGGAAGHPFFQALSLSEPGYMNRAQVDQNYSAVTAACLLVRKALYEQVGGMDEYELAVLYNDVDLCIKLRRQGYRIVWTPYATLVHHNSATLSGDAADMLKVAMANERKKQERGIFWKRWMPLLANDPAYNCNLTLVEPGYEVEDTVVIDWDVNFHDRPRILAAPLSGGSGEYRVIAPFRALSRAGLAQCDVIQMGQMFKTRVLMPVELERAKPDTLVLQAAIDDRQIEAMELYRQYNSDILRVFVLDDLMTQIPRQNSFYRYSYRDAKPRLRRALALCDRAIVTTEPLAEFCRPMIGDVRVIPNRLERALWGDLKSLRSQGMKPRVGWAGAQQHKGDLALMSEVVKATAQEVDWVFFGMCPDELRPYVHEFHDFVLSFYDYPVKLASLNLDLAVAPLEVNTFNEAKSNLRLLEYGIMGWPVVCTDIYPYQNAPVKRVPNDTQAWIEAIRERVNNLDAAYAEGDQLRQWVLDHYMLEDHLDEWMAALVRS